jgi:hypothetical protein
MEYKYFKAGMTPEQVKELYRRYIQKYHNGDPKSEVLFEEITREYRDAKEDALFQERKRTGTLTGLDKAIIAEDKAREAIGKAKNAASAYIKDAVNSAVDEHERRVQAEEAIRQSENTVSQSLRSKKYTKEDYNKVLEEYKKYLLDRIVSFCKCSSEELHFGWSAFVCKKNAQDVWEQFQYKTIPALEEKGVMKKSALDGHAIREKLEWIVYQFSGNDETKTEKALLKLEVYFGEFIIDCIKKVAQKFSDPVDYIDRERVLKQYQSTSLSKKISDRYKDAKNHFTLLFVLRFGLLVAFLVVETIFRISYVLHGEFNYVKELVFWFALDAFVAWFYIKGAYGNARRHLRLRRARFDREQMRIDSKKGPIFRFLIKHDMI